MRNCTCVQPEPTVGQRQIAQKANESNDERWANRAAKITYCDLDFSRDLVENRINRGHKKTERTQTTTSTTTAATTTAAAAAAVAAAAATITTTTITTKKTKNNHKWCDPSPGRMSHCKSSGPPPSPPVNREILSQQCQHLINSRPRTR